MDVNFTKPNRESIVEAVNGVVRERQPWRFPPLDSWKRDPL